MGKEIDLKLCLKKAEFYATQVDCNPAHTGEDNGVLPPRCLSGLYLIEIINKALWREDILCATSLQIDWKKPVFIQDKLKLRTRVLEGGGTLLTHFWVIRDRKTIANGTLTQKVKRGR